MSADKGGGVCKMMTMADKGGRGVRQMLTMADKGGGQMLTLADKGGRGFWLLMISLIKCHTARRGGKPSVPYRALHGAVIERRAPA